MYFQVRIKRFMKDNSVNKVASSELDAGDIDCVYETDFKKIFIF